MNLIDVPLRVKDIVEFVEGGRLNPLRLRCGPVGPAELECRPCGHSWVQHDDTGCMWHLCRCPLPGERK